MTFMSDAAPVDALLSLLDNLAQRSSSSSSLSAQLCAALAKGAAGAAERCD
jgi:hypothetical protein